MSDRWHAIEPGAQTGSVQIHVTDALIEEHLHASGIDESSYAAAGPPRLAPPDLLPSVSVKPLFQSYLQQVVGPNVRVRQSLRFVRSVHVGDTLRATGRIVDKHEVSGRQFFTVEAAFVNERGETVLIDRRTQMLLQAKEGS